MLIHLPVHTGCTAAILVSLLVPFGCGGGSGSSSSSPSSGAGGGAGSVAGSGGASGDVTSSGAAGSSAVVGGSTASGGQSATGGGQTGGTSRQDSHTGTAGSAGGTSSSSRQDSHGGTAGAGAGGQGGVGGKTTGGSGGAAGGSSGVGGSTGSASAGASGNARLAGVCRAGESYPAPALTGTPKQLHKASGASNGTFEGPVWLAGKSLLLFSDVTFTSPVNPSQIWQLTPPSTVTSFMADAGTNGMAVDGDGVVYACSHKVQGIVKLDFATATFTTVVDNYQGKKFNSPNDLVLRSDGTIYFTDPSFQLGNRTSETGKKGVYRVSPSGTVSLVDDTFKEPNGITLSPDETILYVADYNGNAIKSFKVAADGSTSGVKDFVGVSAPDGLAVDCLGNVYVASGGSASTIQVFSPTASKVASLAVGSSLSNLAFGGSEGKTLYITAGKTLYSLDMNLPGYY